MKIFFNSLLIAAAIPMASPATMATEKPNVLFIAIDDFRPELGCYGSAQVKTPHLDRLASQGVVFNRAYCQVPVCGASRASLLTGILPTPGRFTNYDTRADRDAPGAVTLPEACHFGNGDAVVTKRFTYTSYRGGKAHMLYDLENDPDENENVADKPEYRETLVKMKRLLQERQAEAAGSPGAAAQPEPVMEAQTDDRKAPGYEGEVPMPTHSNVRYGDHDRHVLDFWQAESDKPTPLVLVIHGGGWTAGSKERLIRFADPGALLEAGISVAAHNYRLMKHARDVSPPVKAPMHDSARALQFLRGKAAEWNIDPERIAAAGGSAGACTALWLAYHDDMADADSNDPVARESTRLFCAAVRGAQTSLDPAQMKKWIPNITYGGHAFGKRNFAQFLAERENILPWIAEYSPYALVSEDDPPVAIFYGAPAAMGAAQRDATHSANFGIGLQQRCRELGIDCEIIAPERTPPAEGPTKWLIKALGANE